jgi:hypothetical protein
VRLLTVSSAVLTQACAEFASDVVDALTVTRDDSRRHYEGRQLGAHLRSWRAHASCCHDRDKAQAKGSKDIFVNILTDTGLVQRYVTDWAGPNAVIKSISLRLGVPWYAYDTVTFKGEVTAVEDGLITLKVVGSNSLGDHVIATAALTIGGA